MRASLVMVGAMMLCSGGVQAAEGPVETKGAVEEGKSASDFRKTLGRRYPSVGLECVKSKNQHVIGGELNGKGMRMLLDSGASRTFLSMGSMKRLGFETKLVGVQRGIGGDDEMYSVKVEKLGLGGVMSLSSGDYPALPMPLTPEIDGLVGGDVLKGANCILDHGQHRMYVVGNTADPLLGLRAAECGYHRVPLEEQGKTMVAVLKIKGQECRFVVDTGAESTMLDEAVAKVMGLPMMETEMKAGGVGAEHQRLGLVTLDEVGIGDLVYRRYPMLVMPLEHVQTAGGKKEMGILGSDFLWSSGCLIDFGNQCLYLPEDPVADIRDFASMAGEMYGSDEQMKQVWEESKSVSVVELKSFEISKKTKVVDKNGKAWVGVVLKVAVKECLKGELAPVGKDEEIGVLIPDEGSNEAMVHRLFRGTPVRIYFERPNEQDQAVARKYSAVIWADGLLPRAQIQRKRSEEKKNLKSEI